MGREMREFAEFIKWERMHSEYATVKDAFMAWVKESDVVCEECGDPTNVVLSGGKLLCVGCRGELARQGWKR